MESWLIRLATNQPASRGVETAKYKLPQIQLQLIIITIVLVMSMKMTQRYAWNDNAKSVD